MLPAESRSSGMHFLVPLSFMFVLPCCAISQPEVPDGSEELDKMSHLVRGLQRPETLAFLMKGFARLLRNAYATQQARRLGRTSGCSRVSPQ